MNGEVVVVGGGPAGAALAGLLARQGGRVRLLEAAAFPRPKPCGECLNPGAVAALGRLGLWEAVAPLRPVPLRGWRLVAGGVDCTADFPGGLRAMGVDRQRLDAALLRWAADQGVDVVERTRATGLLWNGHRVVGVRAAGRCGTHRLPAALVVGADGLRSVTARRLGLVERSRTPPKVALTAHWSGIDGLGERGELHFRDGWVCGIAPVGEGVANVTLVLPAAALQGGTTAARCGGRPSQEAVLARWPGLRQRFAHARPLHPPLTTGPFDQPVRALWTPGALLIGDAAGYYDPLTGQGIYRALRSAELAAPAAMAALTGGPEAEAAAAPTYQRRLRAEWSPALRLQRWIDAVTRRPGLLSAGLRLLHATPAARRWLLRQVGDCLTPKE